MLQFKLNLNKAQAHALHDAKERSSELEHWETGEKVTEKESANMPRGYVEFPGAFNINLFFFSGVTPVLMNLVWQIDKNSLYGGTVK